MKKLGKAVSNTAKVEPQSVLSVLGKYVVRGVLAGTVFEGTFLMLNFQNRIIRGVTSNQLGSFNVNQSKLEGQINKLASRLRKGSLRLFLQIGLGSPAKSNWGFLSKAMQNEQLFDHIPLKMKFIFISGLNCLTYIFIVEVILVLKIIQYFKKSMVSEGNIKCNQLQIVIKKTIEKKDLL